MTSGVRESVSNIELIDSQGKLLRVNASWNPYANGLEVDVSDLNHGLYLIKITIEYEDRIFRIIKE